MWMEFVSAFVNPLSGIGAPRVLHSRSRNSQIKCFGARRTARQSATRAQGFGGSKQSQGVRSKQPKDWRTFERWLTSNGAELEAVMLSEFGDGLRGVVATRDIQTGEVLISIPRELILDVADAEMSPVSGIWKMGCSPQETPPLPGYAKLALALIYESRLGDTSTRRPYIQMLPSANELEDDGGPSTTWSDEELEATGCGKLIYDSKKLRSRRDGGGHPLLQPAALASAWNELDLRGAAPTSSELAWAVTVVTSRSLTIQYPGEAGRDTVTVSGLVPMVDMLNHDGKLPPDTAKGLSKDGSRFVVIATSPIKKGEQVCLSYGALPNIFLLEQFGFLLPSLSSPPDVAFVGISHLLEEGEQEVVEGLKQLAAQGKLMREADGSPAPWQPAGRALRRAMLELSSDSAEGVYRDLLHRQIESLTLTTEVGRAFEVRSSARRRMGQQLCDLQTTLLRGELAEVDAGFDA